MCETQIVALPVSYDGEYQPDVLGITGASAALAISNIPFDSVVSGVRVGRVDGSFIANPTVAQTEQSDMDIVVAGTDEAVVMVEGGAKEVNEEDILKAVSFGHGVIKELNALQRKLIDLVGQPAKREFDEPEKIPELDAEVEEAFTNRVRDTFKIKEKMKRQKAMRAVVEDAVAQFEEKYPEKGAYVVGVVNDIEKREMRKLVLDEGVRVDGRGYTDIRPIACDIGILPRSHGSALFTRGETQSMVSTTLGTSSDEQMLDTIEGESWKRYMLHYNFPNFCVGEVGPFRGPGRREVGHGALAERAILPMIPDKDDFPYTIRIVSEILESNGSSSMASVCGASLALMDAGVPMPKAVAGIAMGMIVEGDKTVILSDILGAEDHLGDMDFKVTGTTEGITAFQMDTKISGITEDVMMRALHQAREGRLHILGIMNETIAEPREDISPYAPKITTLTIPVDRIRDVIGPGGKIIRGIQDETGASIEVEDDGTVRVFAVNAESAKAAVDKIKLITAEPEVDAIYEGPVKSILPFGAFVEILPGRDGLLHISEITHRRLERVEDELEVGDVVKVKVLEISRDGKVRLSRRALLDPPPGGEREEGSNRERRGGDRPRRGGGRGDRGPRDRR